MHETFHVNSVRIKKKTFDHFQFILIEFISIPAIIVAQRMKRKNVEKK